MLHTKGDGVVFMPEIRGGLMEDKDSMENGGTELVAEEEEEDDDEEGGGDDEEEEKIVNTVTTKKKGSAGKGSWDWKKDFMSIVKNIAGKRKITAVRPSTAAIGNWGILQGDPHPPSMYHPSTHPPLIHPLTHPLTHSLNRC